MKLAFWSKPKEEPVEEEQPEQQSGNESAELSRLRVKIESLDEIRKANAERFSRTSEQIGELRGMILDVNRSVSEIEVKSTKATDLVEAVQPDKLMVEVRRTDSKIEAVRANIESNEAMMKTIMAELKELRTRLNTFRGLEQVVKLSEDVKKDLTQIQKTAAMIERHADKSETIFSEMQVRFAELDRFSGTIKELKTSAKELTDAVDTLKVQTAKKAERVDHEKLLKKVDEFEAHVSNVLDLLSRKAKDQSDQYSFQTRRFQELFDVELRKGKKLADIIERLTNDNVNLASNMGRIKAIEADEAKEEKLLQAQAPLQKRKWFSWRKAAAPAKAS